MSAVITDNLPIWTSAPNGIKKLRELILELAVRGLLVPQDPNDEPASVLLQKIAAEKDALVKAGKIKQPKPLLEIAEAETPFALPTGWEWVRLGDISQINPRNEVDDSVEVSFVPMTLISTSHRGVHEQEIRQWGEVKKGFTHFADGDIGVAKITPCFENSKAAVFTNLRNGFGAGTTELHIVRPYGKTLSPFFVLTYFKAPQFLLVGEGRMTGTAGQKRVPKEFVSGNPFPLPPLTEQSRIVAKVDELMALCDRLEQEQDLQQALHQTLVSTVLDSLTQAASPDAYHSAWSRIAAHFDMLFSTMDSINQLKQTLLQLAVMGKLVPQDPNDEPASLLLQKIAAEKDALIKAGKIKKQKPLPEIGENEKPFELPVGWEWERLGEITHQVTDGAHHTPTYIAVGIPFLSVKDMSSGVLDFSDTRFISDDQHQELTKRCKPELGDLLLTKVGTTGIPVLIKTTQPFSIFVSVALIKFNQKMLSGDYLSLLIKSPIVKKQSDEGTEGIGNKNLVLRKISAFLLAVPPLPEQSRIVAKVDQLMALCDRLVARLQEAQTTQTRLAEAIVEQAVA